MLKRAEITPNEEFFVRYVKKYCYFFVKTAIVILFPICYNLYVYTYTHVSAGV